MCIYMTVFIAVFGKTWTVQVPWVLRPESTVKEEGHPVWGPVINPRASCCWPSCGLDYRSASGGRDGDGTVIWPPIGGARPIGHFLSGSCVRVPLPDPCPGGGLIPGLTHAKPATQMGLFRIGPAVDLDLLLMTVPVAVQSFLRYLCGHVQQCHRTCGTETLWPRAMHPLVTNVTFNLLLLFVFSSINGDCFMGT